MLITYSHSTSYFPELRVPAYLISLMLVLSGHQCFASGILIKLLQKWAVVGSRLTGSTNVSRHVPNYSNCLCLQFDGGSNYAKVGDLK